MKKLNIVLLSILTIVFTSVLVGCNFKKVEAKFTEPVISISVDAEQPLSLDDLLTVKNVGKNQIGYFADKADIVEIANRGVVGKKSGRSKVYATYNKNYLASIDVVVRKKFSAPTGFETEEQDGKVILKWAKVSDSFESEIVSANEYNIKVEKTVAGEVESKQTIREERIGQEEIELESETGKGLIYDVTISAVGDGFYFDDGQSVTTTVYVGFMPWIERSSLVWNNGNLSWAGKEIENANYQVKIKPEDGVEQILDDKQEEKSKDLTDYFNNANPGRYEVSVLVYDKTEGESAKYTRESEKIVVTKLAVPELVKEDGSLRIVSEADVEQYVLKLTSGTKNKEITFENTDKSDIVTTLSFEEVGEELSGIFDVGLEAKSSGYYYNNSNSSLGKIYKIGNPTLEEVGAASETAWNVKVKFDQNLVDTTVTFVNGEGQTQTQVLTANTKEAQVALNLTISPTKTTTHTFTAVGTSLSTTANGQNVFVVKSDESNSVTVTDLCDFKAFENGEYISHSYDEENGNSIISFNAVSGATQYDLYLNGSVISNYTKSGEDIIQLKLDCPLEKLADEEKKYVIKIVAKTDDDRTAINTTSPQKTITLLDEVAKNVRDDNKTTMYTWQEVVNADGYHVEIYKIGYEDFRVESTDFDVSNSERFKPVKKFETSETEFDFATLGDYVGYYYIRVYAKVNDVEKFVVSGKCLHDKIAVSTKLQFSLDNVEFGVDEGKYFLQIDKLEHVHQFELNVGGASQGPVDNNSLEEKNNRFDLPQDFSANVEEPTTITLKAVASSDNKLLYEDSDVVSLTIKQIRDAKFSASGDSDISFDNRTETLYVSPKNIPDMSKFFVKAGASNSSTLLPGQTADLKIARTSSSSDIAVQVTYYGSEYDNMTKLYSKDINGQVVLESVTNFSLSRTESPTGFEYYNGDLKFIDATNGDSANGFFVLRVKGTTLNDGQSLEIDVEFQNTVVVYLNGNKIETPIQSSLYLTNGTERNQKVIKYSQIIDLMKAADPEIETTYLQLKEIDFNVFVYLLRDFGDGAIKLSSPDAKLKSDNGKTDLKVVKMPKPELSVDFASANAYSPEIENLMLAWTGVETDNETSFVLTYGANSVNVKSTNYSIRKSDLTTQTVIEIYVEATNPNYLNSDTSDVISVYVLRGIESVSLTDKATLVCDLFDKDVDKFEKIVCKHDGRDVELSEKTASIEGAGTYTFGLMGKQGEDGVYYLGSKANTWTVKNLSEKAPSDTNIKPIVDTSISWEEFGLSTNSGLEYVLIFLDDNGEQEKAFVVSDITSNSIDAFTELAETLIGFEGSLKMQLLAHIKAGTTYTKDSTIYYSDKQDLLNKNVTKTQEYNYYIYKQQTTNNFATIIKLKTPEISAVEFVHSDKINYWDAQSANMQVTFKGNYGASAQFKISINGVKVEGVDTLEGKNENGGIYEYTFTLEATIYLNSIEDVSELTIQAISDKADRIPSATLRTEILRAKKIVGLSFADDEGNLTHKLKITLPISEGVETARDNRADGGVVLKIDYKSATTSTTYRLEMGDTDLNDWSNIDLSEFFKSQMKEGGTFTISAFIKYNNTGRYILPSKDKITADFTILKSLVSERENIEKTTNGFRLSNAAELNSDRTIYFVEYNELQSTGETKVLNQRLTSANNYTFVAPNEWIDSSPTLRIYATESEALPSVVFEYVLTLNRIKEVTSVSMKRSLHTSTFSWLPVSGAKAYKLGFYRSNVGGSRGEVVFECDDISTTQVTASELFGENYEKLLEFGRVTQEELVAGFEMTITIVVVPSAEGVDNSFEYEFKVKIVAQDINEKDLYVDEKGVINFNNDPSKKRVYTVNFVELPEVEVEPYGWRNVTKTKLDTEAIDNNVNKFKIVIATVEGEETEQPVAYEKDKGPFALASVGFESKVFTFTNGIRNIEISEMDSKNLFFTFLGADESYTIYAGLDSREIFADDGNVVEIELEEPEVPSEQGLGLVYALSTLVTKLSTIQKLSGLNTIYFWANANGQDDEEALEQNIVAKAYNLFKLNLVSSVEGEMVKLGKEVVGRKDDYVNTFALFENSDSSTLITLGFNIRLTDESGSEYLRFVTGANAKNSVYFEERKTSDKVFAINLTEVFEDIERADIYGELKLLGKFKIEISKLTQENSQLTFADWYIPKQEGGSDFAFTRLIGAEEGSVELNRGDLRWQGSGDDSQFYKVYFITDLIEGDQFNNFEAFNAYVAYFNASEYAGTNGVYYLAVQGVNENPFYISSIRKFVTNDVGSPVEVVKNQISSKLKLEAGVLSIDWAGSDFVTTILGDVSGSWADFAKQLTTQAFKGPFTFTMKDIINGNLTMSFEFKQSTGASIIRNFDARILLGDLFSTTTGQRIKTRIDDIIGEIADSDETIDTLRRFVKALEQGEHGVGSGRNIFDDEFEKVQTGEWSLAYRLLGGKTSLNSGVYSFENDIEGLAEENKNKLYANEQPIVSAVKVDHETDRAQTSFKVVFAKSKIYQATGDSINLVEATKYKVRLGNYVFDIIGEEDSYSMVMVDAPSDYVIPELDANIPVYCTGSSGDEATPGTSHLMFYLNLNGGKSILGQYNIRPARYEMQIFAVGNNLSVSSKSEKFLVNFLSFDESIKIADGTFVWQPTEGRNTTVIYKKSGDRNGEVAKDIGADITSINSTFALEDAADGLYDYIKFVVKGEIDLRQNIISVDSSVYQVNNILKLHSPTLSTQFGLLSYDASTNFVPDHQVDIFDCYSDKENMFVYMVYNDASYDAETGITMKKTLIDDRESSLRGTLNTYEVGKTGLEATEGSDDPDIPYTDYKYKSTEELAKTFYMYMLGSDAEFSYTPNSGQNYYIKNVNYGIDSGRVALAVRSDVREGEDNTVGHIKASMLDSVTNIHVEGGSLVWNPVTSRQNVDAEDLVPDSDIIYRVVIEMYTISNADNTETNVSEKFVYYTSETTFDFSNVEKNENIEKYQKEGRVLYTRATVQAVALNVSNTSVAGTKYVNLLDGRYAYGSPNYQGDTNYKVLMGGSTPKDGITRIKEIDEGSLKVVDGRLTWSYTVSDTSINTDNFDMYYRFIVVDENDNEIAGDYTLQKLDLKFNVVFVENVEEYEGTSKLLSGNHRLRVYVAPGTEQSQDQITSFASPEIAVEKLATITEVDYKIVSETLYETLDLSDYFKTNQDKIVYLKVTDNKDLNSTFKFGIDESLHVKSKLLIVSDSKMGDFDRPDNYEEEYVGFVEISDRAKIVYITFYVEDINVGQESSNKLTSDVSEEFELERMQWPECTIEWNQEEGKFTWSYDDFSLKKEGTLNEVEKGWRLLNSVMIYTTKDMMSSDSPTSLSAGRIYIKNNPDVDGYVEIYYDEETRLSVKESETTRFFSIYTNSKKNYEENWFDVVDEEGNTVTKDFQDDEMFKIEVDGGENTIIVQGEKYYRVNKDDISYPLFLLKISYFDAEGEKIEELNVNTRNRYYAPEIISVGEDKVEKIGLSIRIKRNENSIQSVEKVYEGVAKLDLFESGDGTRLNPYIISSAEQFLNIRYRMSREITTYVGKNGHEETVAEGKTYYYKLGADIDLTTVDGEPFAIEGFLFKGTFDGNLFGDGRSITYESKNVADLTSTIVVSKNDTVYHLAGQDNSTFTKGSALFETLSSVSTVSSLNLNVTFRFGGSTNWASWFRTNLLLAGLAIDNNGHIDSVNLTGLSTDFCAQGPKNETVILAYGGIVGRNSGLNTDIKNCTISADVRFDDQGQGMAIFYGGVVAFNYAEVSGCRATNKVTLNLLSSSSNAQVGGIACSSSSSSSSVIKDCSSSFVIEVTSGSNCSGNVSGVVVCGRGKVEIAEEDVQNVKLNMPAGYSGIVFNKVNCVGAGI